VQVRCADTGGVQVLVFMFVNGMHFHVSLFEEFRNLMKMKKISVYVMFLMLL